MNVAFGKADDKVKTFDDVDDVAQVKAPVDRSLRVVPVTAGPSLSENRNSSLASIPELSTGNATMDARNEDAR